jgi:hypothetical protein
MRLTVRHNAAAATRRHLALGRALDLDSPGDGYGVGRATWGEELADAAADRIRRRSERQRAPDGSRWAPNAPAYKRRKGGLPEGVLTGEMLSPEQVDGRRVVHARVVTMRYATKARARTKALWFQDGTRRGGRRHQPPRPFYDLDRADEQFLAIRVRVHLDRIRQAHWR